MDKVSSAVFLEYESQVFASNCLPSYFSLHREAVKWQSWDRENYLLRDCWFTAGFPDLCPKPKILMDDIQEERWIHWLIIRMDKVSSALFWEYDSQVITPHCLPSYFSLQSREKYGWNDCLTFFCKKSPNWLPAGWYFVCKVDLFIHFYFPPLIHSNRITTLNNHGVYKTSVFWSHLDLFFSGK